MYPGGGICCIGTEGCTVTAVIVVTPGVTMARVCGGAGLLWEQYMIEEASSMTQAGI